MNTIMLRIKGEYPALVNEILDQFPPWIWESKTTTFLDPEMGGGQFVREVERRLRDAGHADDNIKNRVFGLTTNALVLLYMKNKYKLVGQYIVGDFLAWKPDMTPDVIVGNPPFNEASDSSNTIAGTSGNTTLYKQFIDKAFAIRGKDGIVALVTQRNGIRHAMAKHNVTMMNYDTSNYWEFTAGYFISNGEDASRQNITVDPVMQKTYGFEHERSFRHAIGGSYKTLLGTKVFDQPSADMTEGVVDFDGTRGWISGRAVPSGPKLIFRGLESKDSYVVMDDSHYIGSSCTFFFETQEEAEAARLFILNNKLVHYLKKRLADKTLGFVFRYMKPFDHTQIKTGKEYPVEYNLTPEEIEYVERNG